MKIIHAWILAPSYQRESHHLFRCKTRFGLFVKLVYAKIFWDYIEVKEDTDWFRGVMPSKSGNYEVLVNNVESRGDFSAFHKCWKIDGQYLYTESVGWRPSSYRRLERIDG